MITEVTKKIIQGGRVNYKTWKGIPQLTDGKDENLYESMFVINCLYYPFLSCGLLGMKKYLSMRSLTILYIILALSLHCFNGVKLLQDDLIVAKPSLVYSLFPISTHITF